MSRFDPVVVPPAGRIKGAVRGDCDVEIRGTLLGDVDIEGMLWVRSGGLVRATVRASRVHVEGRLEGHVKASRQVSISPTGILKGEVEGDLVVEEGGQHLREADPDFTQGSATTASQRTPGPLPAVSPALQRTIKPARPAPARAPAPERPAATSAAQRSDSAPAQPSPKTPPKPVFKLTAADATGRILPLADPIGGLPTTAERQPRRLMPSEATGRIQPVAAPLRDHSDLPSGPHRALDSDPRPPLAPRSRRSVTESISRALPAISVATNPRHEALPDPDEG